MFLVIGNVLGAHEVAAIREAAAALAFEDGRATAGRFAREVKANAQAAPPPERDAILEKVQAALMGNALLRAAARPRRIVRLLLSRYREGETYGTHVDDAIIGGGAHRPLLHALPLGGGRLRGRRLVVEDALEARSVKLAPGDMVLYPSNTLHRVEPVTAGEHLAVVG